jgi:hypothetical protein
MVKGEMVLLKGVRIGTLYKLLWNVESTGCNNIVFLEVDSTYLRMNQFKLTQQAFVKSTQPCYGTKGWDTLEKKDFRLCIIKV